MHPVARPAGGMAIDVTAAVAVVDRVPHVEDRAGRYGRVAARRPSCVRARVQRAGQSQDRGAPRFTRSRLRRTKSCSRAVRSRKLDGRCMLPTCIARQ